jgi:hypothetical protein
MPALASVLVISGAGQAMVIALLYARVLNWHGHTPAPPPAS